MIIEDLDFELEVASIAEAAGLDHVLGKNYFCFFN